MNRKQEAFAWAIGLLISGIAAYNGYREGEWFTAFALPIGIVGALVVYRLRTPGTPTTIGGPGLVLLVLAFGFSVGQIRSARFSTLAVRWEYDALQYDVRDVRSGLERVESEVESLDATVAQARDLRSSESAFVLDVFHHRLTTVERDLNALFIELHGPSSTRPR